MTEIERNIGDLPWRQAPSSLEARIFDDDPVTQPSPEGGKRGISFPRAAALAAAAAVVGFVVGSGSPKSVKEIARVRTDIRVVETFSSLNSFDFTAGEMQVLPGEFTGSIDAEVEDTK